MILYINRYPQIESSKSFGAQYYPYPMWKSEYYLTFSFLSRMYITDIVEQNIWKMLEARKVFSLKEI